MLIGHSFHRRNFLRKSCATFREKCRRAAPRTVKSDKPAAAAAFFRDRFPELIPATGRFIQPPHGPNRKHIQNTYTSNPPYCYRGVITSPLHRNGNSCIVQIFRFHKNASRFLAVEIHDVTIFKMEFQILCQGNQHFFWGGG
jgi:hypothetical protein